MRWQTRFFDTASAALAVDDLETRLSILEATEKVLEVCGQQVRPHARAALEMLLRGVTLFNGQTSIDTAHRSNIGLSGRNKSSQKKSADLRYVRRANSE